MSIRTIEYNPNKQFPTSDITLIQYKGKNLDKRTYCVKNCLLDSGALRTIGSQNFLRSLGLDISKTDCVYKLTNAAQQSMGVVEYCINANLLIDKLYVTNAVIFLADPSMNLSYNIIIGNDILSNGKNMNLSNQTISINHVQLLPAERKFLILDQGFHKHCESRDPELTLTDFKKSIHCRTVMQTVIEPGKSCVIKVVMDNKISIEKIRTQINHRFREILDFVGFVFCDDVSDLWITVSSKNRRKTIVIQEDTVILCGFRDEKCIFIECNHVISTQNLPNEERAQHYAEYDEWLERRHKLISEVDICAEIESETTKATKFNRELKNLLEEHKWCISRCSSDVGYIKDFVCQFEFEATWDGRPINRRPYRMDPSVSEQVENMLLDLEDKGILTQVNSSFNSALMAIKKADKSQLRLVQDYSKTLNGIIHLPNSPILNNRACLNSISAHLSKIKTEYGENHVLYHRV